MAERYSRLFTLPENLYTEGSPVIIAAGALLKDNQTGKVLAQLKLRSITEKDIQAVKVRLNLFDTALCPSGEDSGWGRMGTPAETANAGRCFSGHGAGQAIQNCRWQQFQLLSHAGKRPLVLCLRRGEPCGETLPCLRTDAS